MADFASHPSPRAVTGPPRHDRVLAYALTIAMMLGAFALHLWVTALSAPQADFIFLVPAVLLVGAIGGLGPGVLATVVCLGLNLAVARVGPVTSAEAATAAVFAFIGVGTAGFGEWLRRARRRAAVSMQELAAREAHLQSILATIPDAMVVIDDKGIIRSFNAAAQRLFGHTEAEAVGRNVSMLMPSPDAEAHDAHIARYLRTGERRIIGSGRVVVGERRDGSTFPIEITVGEMRPDGGRFFIGFVRDISERQETKARLQELQAELVHISRLTALGEMASALAHELNQPLSAIANYMTGSRRLLSGSTDETSMLVREAVDKAVEQSLRAGQIIRRLRDFVAHRESERRLESLRKLIEEASALALVGARELGVRVRRVIDPAVDLVLVDKVQIQQVLLNLMRNAIEAMEDPSRRELTVSTGAGEDAMVVVSVADTGSGISAEIADQLFQPFVTTKAHGMGIGLSISRTIVEGHDGRIWVEPNPGGGTVFRFTLPRVPEEELRDGG